MLQVPQSIVNRWSPFETQWLDARAVLELWLGEAPCVDGCDFSLADVAALGWHSDTAGRLIDQACETLAQRCVERGRYAHNVGVLQKFDSWDTNHLALATASDLHRLAHPPRRLSDKASKAAEIAQRVEMEARYSAVPSWAMLAPDVHDGDLVLVAAPLNVQSHEGGDATAALCDYPYPARRVWDPSVRLIASSDDLELLRQMLGNRGAWHPFCRCLARVRDDPSGRALRLLRLELRIPLPEARPYSHHPTWSEALVKEAASHDGLSEATWAAKVLTSMPYSALLTGLSAIEKVADPQARTDLQRQVALAAEYFSERSLMRDAGTPFEGPDAFWCATAALLAGWPESFALRAEQREALLTAFDARYDQAWQEIAGDPALSGSVRYTPEVMAAVRAQLIAQKS